MPRYAVPVLLALAALRLGSAAFGDRPASLFEDHPPAEPSKPKVALAGRAAYDRALNLAAVRHREAVDGARQEYVAALREGLNQSLERKSLDQANAYKAELDAVLAGGAAAPAQPPTRARPTGRAGGALTVVRAAYGDGDTWVDVTDKVRKFVRGNRLELTDNLNKALGADPLPGVPKYLDLLAEVDGRPIRVKVASPSRGAPLTLDLDPQPQPQRGAPR